MLANPLLAAQIQVSLDRNPVPLNESFTLTFAADSEPDADPDFSPLQANFEILNQGQSSQFSIVNGHATRNISWQVQVVAKKSGTLDIPPIAFGHDHSNPFSVTITNGAVRSKQGSDANLLVEAEAEPKNPYVQSQVILTVRVLSRVAFNGDLAQPEIPDSIVEKIGDDREFVTLRDGVQFKVDERRFVVFPQKSGRMTIGPINLTAQMGGASFSPFFRPSSRQERLHSDPINLDVRPIPQQFTGKHWLPATDLKLQEIWSPTSLKVPAGEPITRTLTIQAEGTSVGMLPEISTTDLAAEVKQYPDQPVTREEKVDNGISSQRQQKTALIVTMPGKIEVPALEIPWWNTRTDRMEVARLPAQSLVITGTAQQSQPVPVIPEPAAGLGSPKSPREQPIDSSPATASGPAAYPTGNPLWFWLALLFGAGWLFTALAWWWTQRCRPKPTQPVQITAARSDRHLQQAIETACRANDPMAARRALETWAAAHWSDQPWVNIEDQFSGPLQTEVTRMNRAIYGGPRHNNGVVSRCGNASLTNLQESGMNPGRRMSVMI